MKARARRALLMMVDSGGTSHERARARECRCGARCGQPTEVGADRLASPVCVVVLSLGWCWRAARGLLLVWCSI